MTAATAHVPAHLQANLQTAASAGLELSFRPMFGGIMGYADGRVFCSLSDVGLALKMAGAAHAELSAVPGARPLRYEPYSPPSKTYVVVPDSMLSDHLVLAEWVSRSVAGLKPASAKKARR